MGEARKRATVFLILTTGAAALVGLLAWLIEYFRGENGTVAVAYICGIYSMYAGYVWHGWKAYQKEKADLRKEAPDVSNAKTGERSGCALKMWKNTVVGDVPANEKETTTVTLTFEWKFRPDQRKTGNFVLIITGKNKSGSLRVDERFTDDGIWQDHIDYGETRVYTVAVEKEYFIGFGALSFTECYDMISFRKGVGLELENLTKKLEAQARAVRAESALYKATTEGINAAAELDKLTGGDGNLLAQKKEIVRREMLAKGAQMVQASRLAVAVDAGVEEAVAEIKQRSDWSEEEKRVSEEAMRDAAEQARLAGE